MSAGNEGVGVSERFVLPPVAEKLEGFIDPVTAANVWGLGVEHHGDLSDDDGNLHRASDVADEMMPEARLTSLLSYAKTLQAAGETDNALLVLDERLIVAEMQGLVVDHSTAYESLAFAAAQVGDTDFALELIMDDRRTMSMSDVTMNELPDGDLESVVSYKTALWLERAATLYVEVKQEKADRGDDETGPTEGAFRDRINASMAGIRMLLVEGMLPGYGTELRWQALKSLRNAKTNFTHANELAWGANIIGLDPDINYPLDKH